MSPDETKSTSKVCPTCGTRLSENATRCLVCGKTFTPATASAKAGSPANKTVKSPRIPEVTLSLPVALGLMVLILAIGAAVVFFVLQETGVAAGEDGTPVAAEATATTTVTPTLLQSPTATQTATIEPTGTPLPPVEYTVQSGDFCSTIAYYHNVSVQSIQNANPGLNCESLTIGSKINVPQPTPTASPAPTGTLSAADATEAACQTVEYKVADGDTLQGIANNYAVSMDAIKIHNGLTSDIVYAGLPLIIPLCERLPTAGPTPTATNPPDYTPPNLLLPADGAAFTAANDTITLQWAAVGTLRQNEAYRVTIEDITEGKGRKLIEYVTDTKFMVPASFRPNDSVPHIIRWFIVPVRQTGTAPDGQSIYEPAGQVSAWRDFTWWIAGGGSSSSNSGGETPSPETTPTP